MKRMLVLLPLLLGMADCSTIKQIDLKTGVGNEVRGHADTEHRFSVIMGPQVQFKNGVKTDVIYRNRVTDFEENSMEHGFFVGASFPIWRNDK